MSVDPLTNQFPYYTPYQFAGNTPIVAYDLDGKEGIVGFVGGAASEWLAQGLTNTYESLKKEDFSVSLLKKSFFDKVNFIQVGGSALQGSIAANGTITNLAKVGSILTLEVFKAANSYNPDTHTYATETDTPAEIFVAGAASFALGEVAGVATDQIIKAGGTGALKQAQASLENAQNNLNLIKQDAVNDAEFKSIIGEAEKELQSAFRKDLGGNALFPVAKPLENDIIKGATDDLVKAPFVNATSGVYQNSTRPDTITKTNSDGATRTMQWDSTERVYRYESSTPVNWNE